eukprot:CAMPEP_0167818036 /NCGR_PEP_ID=MMETSP0112_2-20121227/4567_1 /TAXON_ID=91324 /ORGANISM="Lotharella globosa, Strain CCCM811" /LENGTH=85 /DNA_ID=CAMNT_0007717947 /DNA_START=459 /DNA_END=716 /DNA_ORIENTATION=+
MRIKTAGLASTGSSSTTELRQNGQVDLIRIQRTKHLTQKMCPQGATALPFSPTGVKHTGHSGRTMTASSFFSSTGGRSLTTIPSA